MRPFYFRLTLHRGEFSDLCCYMGVNSSSSFTLAVFLVQLYAMIAKLNMNLFN